MAMELTHRAGQYRPGESLFTSPSPRAVGVVDVYGIISDPGMGYYPPHVRQDLNGGPCPEGQNSPSALAL